jgi:hypothetical protein
MLKHWYALHNNNCALKNTAIVTAFEQSTSKLSVCITQYFHRSIFKKKVTWKIEWNFLFHTFAVFWMSCSFFCVIPRLLKFICRRFGTLCSIFIGGVPTISSWLFFLLTPPIKMEQTECSEMSAYKIQTLGNHTKNDSKWNLFHYYFTKCYLYKIILPTNALFIKNIKCYNVYLTPTCFGPSWTIIREYTFVPR